MDHAHLHRRLHLRTCRLRQLWRFRRRRPVQVRLEQRDVDLSGQRPVAPMPCERRQSDQPGRSVQLRRRLLLLRPGERGYRVRLQQQRRRGECVAVPGRRLLVHAVTARLRFVRLALILGAAAACHSRDRPSLSDAEAERPIEFRGVAMGDRPPLDFRGDPLAAPVDAAALRGPAPRSFGVGDYDRPADFDPRRKPCNCKPGDPLCTCP